MIYIEIVGVPLIIPSTLNEDSTHKTPPVALDAGIIPSVAACKGNTSHSAGSTFFNKTNYSFSRFIYNCLLSLIFHFLLLVTYLVLQR